MADPITIISFAAAGLKLSFTLYSFADAIGSAGKEIRQTAKDISLFSSVLKQLGVKMKQAHKAGFVANEAFELTREIIVECRSVFGELDVMIEKATTTEKIKVIKMEEDDFEVKELDRDNLTVSYGRRLLYLFKKAEISDQRNRLESLKSSLQLMLALMIFTENARIFTEDEKNGPAEYNSWVAEEKLELESLVLANQAATSDFRKLKTKQMLKKSPAPGSDNIAKFGVIGQLSSVKNDVPVPNQTKQSEPTFGTGSTTASELDSTPAPPTPKFPKFSSLGISKSNEPELAFEVVPPTLSYTSSGNIAPYQSTSFALPPPSRGDYRPPMATTGSLNQYPSERTSVYPSAYPTQNATKDSEPSKTKPLARTSTPGAAVDMLVMRMMTQKGQERPNFVPQYHKPTVESVSEEQGAKSPKPPKYPKETGPNESKDQSPPGKYGPIPKANFSTGSGESALPPGWEMRRDSNGFSYYIDHNTKATSWVRPTAPQSGTRQASNTMESQATATTVEEEEEPLIDLFPRRAPRPY